MYECMCVYIAKQKEKAKQKNNGKSFKIKTNKAKIDGKFNPFFFVYLRPV